MSPSLTRAFPLLFVLLWSTGFIGARLGLPHAPPLTFLLIRYLLVIGLMVLIVLAFKAPWPQRRIDLLHIGISGLLLHGAYLGGVFVAISKGLPAGVASLVVCLQPLLTAVGAGWLLGEAVTRRQWLGLFLGLAGVGLVVSAKIGINFGPEALFPAVIALFAITGGTLYQKRFCPSFDWRSGAVLQFLPTALVTGILAVSTENLHVEWSGEFVIALGWLVLVLSVGAVSLLNWLIRNNNAVNMASLFYLVPPCTAVVAWLLFGETFTPVALIGMGLSIWGVYLARK